MTPTFSRHLHSTGLLLVVSSLALAAPRADATLRDSLRGQGLALVSVSREPVADDVVHFAFTLSRGSTPNAAIRVHRLVRERGGKPRPTGGALMLLHGDFSTFATNFAPVLADASGASGLGTSLALHGFDVWGVDRRWALAGPDADLSDFGEMSLAQELDDLGVALTLARVTRVLTGAGGDRVHLAGFSRGGFLAYLYAAAEARRPAWQQHVKGLVILDVWGAVAPDDAFGRQFVCDNAFYGREALNEGLTDSSNDFFVILGQLVLEAPDEPSPFPFFPGLTNRQAMFYTAGRTYDFFYPTPAYHLLAPTLVGDEPTGFRETSEADAARWFAHAAPHQSMREVVETDELWCGAGAELSAIQVPLLYLGAAGGYGESGLFATTQVGSSDVTRLVIHRFDTSRAAEDFGHGDLLFAADAPTLAWAPLESWLASH